ncbi:MAG TPA: glutathione S-transferase family protein [Stellaceae bacterium]|nr:glutathione S-transferase family protein [Stellaceae bacterium]
MIKLIQFPRAFGLPNPSPFCIKVEVLLKMAGLAYECEFVANPGKGPKGKLPAIMDDGELIGDSEIIRWHLERKYGVDFDKGLAPGERAIGHAFARMAEERTNWVVVYSRWIEDANWPVFRDTLFRGMPGVVRRLIGPQIRKRVGRMLRAQGLGLHTRDEIYAMAVADVEAIGAQLGTKPFLLGPEPTSVDAAVWPAIIGVLVPPPESPLKQAIQRHPALVEYAERMRARFFG